jgi:hypothetical protein
MKKLLAIHVAGLIFLVSSVGLLIPVMASAQGNLTLFPCSGGADNINGAGATGGGVPVPSKLPTGASGEKACTFSDLVELAQAVANKIVQVGLILSPLIFAYAGWLLLTSGANPGKRKDAQKIFLNVVIGLAIMLSAWLVVKLVLTALVNPSIYNNSAFPININSNTGN